MARFNQKNRRSLIEANELAFDNTVSGVLSATDVQTALDELVTGQIVTDNAFNEVNVTLLLDPDTSTDYQSFLFTPSEVGQYEIVVQASLRGSNDTVPVTVEAYLERVSDSNITSLTVTGGDTIEFSLPTATQRSRYVVSRVVSLNAESYSVRFNVTNPLGITSIVYYSSITIRRFN